MIKLSKKQLRAEAEYQEGYYFTGNVYSYENVIFYIGQLVWKTETGKKTENKSRIKEIKKELLKNVNSEYINSAIDIIKNIESIKHDAYKIEQIAYSAGLYGNSGQLHKITLYYKNNITALYYCYY